MFTIYTQILSEFAKLDAQIDAIQAELECLPPGKLVCTDNGKHYKWYNCNQHNKTYIPKGNRQLAEQLAIKKYLTALLNDLLHEKSAIQFYLHHHAEHSKAQQLLKHPAYRTLLAPYFSHSSQELSEWMTASYDCNPQHPEHLIHKSSSGNLVRSKSEAIIDTLLYFNKIPFRYECALTLGEITLFPDFTIRHPRTGETYYWEHFGLMDNPSYSQSTFSKLQLYTNHGIIPSIHLITTYETKEQPLGTDIVEKIITHYFL